MRRGSSLRLTSWSRSATSWANRTCSPARRGEREDEEEGGDDDGGEDEEGEVEGGESEVEWVGWKRGRRGLMRARAWPNSLAEACFSARDTNSCQS